MENPHSKIPNSIRRVHTYEQLELRFWSGSTLICFIATVYFVITEWHCQGENCYFGYAFSAIMTVFFLVCLAFFGSASRYCVS